MPPPPTKISVVSLICPSLANLVKFFRHRISLTISRQSIHASTGNPCWFLRLYSSLLNWPRFNARSFFDYIAVRDKPVDGIRDGRRMSLPIGMAGLTGITNIVGNDRSSRGAQWCPFSILGPPDNHNRRLQSIGTRLRLSTGGLCKPGSLIMSLLLGKTTRQESLVEQCRVGFFNRWHPRSTHAGWRISAAGSAVRRSRRHRRRQRYRLFRSYAPRSLVW